jgi:hypothetical protein
MNRKTVRAITIALVVVMLISIVAPMVLPYI